MSEIYQFCPGGAWPDGLVAGFPGFCSNPPPLQFGCWPPGSWPPRFSHDGGVGGVPGVILACTGVASDENSIATDSVTAMAASAVNLTLFMSKLDLLLPIKEL